MNDKPFNKICWLASHNAFSSKQDGWLYAQQTLNIEEQFKIGVRCFLIDIHWFQDISSCEWCCSSNKEKVMVLAHGENLALNLLQNPHVPRKVDDFFTTIKYLLDTYPTEIITLYIEDYTEDKGIVKLKSILKKKKLLHQCYIKVDKWLKISQMITLNKRLVLITTNQSKIVYNSNFIMSANDLKENHWDLKINPNGDVIRRNNGDLTLFNHFKKVSMVELNYEKFNSYNQIYKRVENFIKVLGIPNYITLDFVEKGDGLKVVNSINEKYY